MLLGGAGLAADIVAFDGGLFTGAAGNRCPQRIFDKFTGLPADGGAHRHRGDLLYHPAVFVGDSLDDVGLIVGAAVDQRGEGRGHLHHVDVEVLAETVGGQVGDAHIVSGVNQARRLAGQVHAGLSSEAEGGLEIGKLGFAQILHDIHHGGVAGVHQGLL